MVVEISNLSAEPYRWLVPGAKPCSKEQALWGKAETQLVALAKDHPRLHEMAFPYRFTQI